MKKVDKERIVAISNMLLEMARGNFSARIVRTNSKDHIEAVMAQLNMFSEELENSFLHTCYMNKCEACFNRINLLFLLDRDENILQCNSSATQLLMGENADLLGSPFIKLLRNNSKKYWKIFRAAMVTDPEADQNIRLEFDTKENLSLNLACNVDSLIPSGDTLVSAAIIQKQNYEKLSQNYRITEFKKMGQSCFFKHRGASISRDDLQKIYKVTDHLIAHYYEPINSLVDLARAFGTNEYKLKLGFKLLHSETIFRFVQNKRLCAASLLMEHSDKPIKGISVMCGFKSTTHFSRVFKEKYGESPKNYRKAFLASISYHIPNIKPQINPLEQ